MPHCNASIVSPHSAALHYLLLKKIVRPLSLAYVYARRSAKCKARVSQANLDCICNTEVTGWNLTCCYAQGEDSSTPWCGASDRTASGSPGLMRLWCDRTRCYEGSWAGWRRLVRAITTVIGGFQNIHSHAKKSMQYGRHCCRYCSLGA